MSYTALDSFFGNGTETQIDRLDGFLFETIDNLVRPQSLELPLDLSKDQLNWISFRIIACIEDPCDVMLFHILPDKLCVVDRQVVHEDCNLFLLHLGMNALNEVKEVN